MSELNNAFNKMSHFNIIITPYLNLIIYIFITLHCAFLPQYDDFRLPADCLPTIIYETNGGFGIIIKRDKKKIYSRDDRRYV